MPDAEKGDQQAQSPPSRLSTTSTHTLAKRVWGALWACLMAQNLIKPIIDRNITAMVTVMARTTVSLR